MTDKTAPRQDIYSRVTAQIIADLEKGVRPWHQALERRARRRPDHDGRCAHNGQPYSGINILMLWAAAHRAGLQRRPIWMTFRQAAELGAHVRKGEKGTPVVYAEHVTRTESDDETGEEAEREIPS